MNPANLRIVPESIWYNVKGEASALQVPSDFGDTLILDPRSLSDPQKMERDLRFFKVSRLAEILRGAAEIADNPIVGEMLSEVFASEQLAMVRNALHEIRKLPTREERDKAALDFVKQSGIVPSAPSLCAKASGIRESLHQKYQQDVKNAEKNINNVGKILPPVGAFYKEKQNSLQVQRDAFQLTPSALQKMAQDEAKVLEAFNQLPFYLKDGFTSEPQTIAVSSLPFEHGDVAGFMQSTQNLLCLSQKVLAENRLPMVLKEEILHWLDDKLSFSKRPEWKKAAAREEQDITPARLKFIKEALDLKVSVLDKDGEDMRLPEFLRNSYHSEEDRAVELLVDYFHVRDHVAATSKEPMSENALNAKMAEVFPHIHALCQQFEQEMIQFSRNSAAKGRAGRT